MSPKRYDVLPEAARPRVTALPKAYVEQVEGSLTSLLEEIGNPERAARVEILADLVVALAFDAVEVPAPIREAAWRWQARRKELGDSAAAALVREHGLEALLFNFWRGFAEQGWLTDATAEILLSRLELAATDPLDLATLRGQAEKLPSGPRFLARIEAAMRSRDSKVAKRLAEGQVDLGLIGMSAAEAKGLGITVRFHANGHLAEMSVGGWQSDDYGRVEGTGARLELEATPGRGSFQQVGKSGGSGFMTSESYSDGAARGTLNSPWHDGEDYAEPKDWLLWVRECMSSVRSAAEAKRGGKGKGKKKKG